MHELSATQGIINSLLELALVRKIHTIHYVGLEVGILTTYEEIPFRYYYDLLKKDHSLLEHSVLEITMVPGTLRCDECQKESLISKEIELVCKECGSSQTTIITGQDVLIKNIKV